MDKKEEKSGRDKVLRALSVALVPLGFSRTKPTYFTRIRLYWVEFGHLHKFTFGPYFRIHFGIRIIADNSQSVVLNGPDSDRIRDWRYFLSNHQKYDFKYNSTPGSIDKCVKDMVAFWNEVGEPWFKKWQDPKKLINSKNFPLSLAAKKSLSEALEGSMPKSSLLLCRKLLGVPKD
jgi:hypothetical protein